MYKMYLESLDGKKATMWSNIQWLHIVKDQKDWYVTKIKKWGIKTIYQKTLNETKTRCDECDSASPVPVKNYKIFKIEK